MRNSTTPAGTALARRLLQNQLLYSKGLGLQKK